MDIIEGFDFANILKNIVSKKDFFFPALEMEVEGNDIHPIRKFLSGSTTRACSRERW